MYTSASAPWVKTSRLEEVKGGGSVWRGRSGCPGSDGGASSGGAVGSMASGGAMVDGGGDYADLTILSGKDRWETVLLLVSRRV